MIWVAASPLGGEESGNGRETSADAVIEMTGTDKSTRRVTTVGAALVVGAGLGLILGLLLWDGPGIALGMAIGAGLGVVAGAVWDGMRPSS